MDNDKLPPIPTPALQRWREFRIQVLPFVVFLAVLTSIVYLWKSYVQPVGVIGYADTNMVNVTSLQDGTIAELFVDRFETVTSNQVIAVVINTDPELIKAQIESVQADIKILAARNAVDEQRTDQAFREFQQELFKLRVDQASDQVQAILATNEYQRVLALFTAGTASQSQLEAEKAKLDRYAALLEERGRQIEDRQKSLDELAARHKTNESDPFAEGVAKKATELELMLKPSTLRAPISGMVSIVHHVKGERILRGMSIVSINDPETRRIIGYIRQPVTRVPSTNDSVTITTRTQTRQTARGQIIRVGSQLEPINPALFAADSKRMEVGLPIVVSVPSGMQLVPGEYLNLHIDYHPPK
jgi:multidrug resistance efflux pump